MLRFRCFRARGRDGDGNTPTQQRRTEYFDYLVVASGYFARPFIPDIPGLIGVFAGERVVHSSAVQEIDELRALLERIQVNGSGAGKLVVVGGSMSGVEAASAVALHLSSMNPGPGQLEVHHVCSRPFWTVPTYLPRSSPNQAPGTSVPFLPLDLVFYDRARRPPGPIEYAVGPLSPDQISRSNAWFGQLLGSEYARIGSFGISTEMQPSWVAIGNDYAEYVRAGAVKVTIGRVAQLTPSNDRASLEITLPNGETSVLDDVAAIILATGFTPSDSLAFLPPSVLSTLEYSPDDAFIPLILDHKGTSHFEIPDLGFVGFYRGPYWGVMEMQARSLAARWSPSPAEHPAPAHSPALADDEIGKETEREREQLRRLRNETRQRSQFPMGDYVGLMESFARALEISRLPIPDPTVDLDSDADADADQPNTLLDPVIPARYPDPYPYSPASASSPPPDDPTKTLTSLATTLSPTPRTASTGEASAATATATAIFRALHGAWHFSRTTTTSQSEEFSAPIPEQSDNKTIESTTAGSATFHPRYVTLPGGGYEREYLYTETEFQDEPQSPPQAQLPRPDFTEPSRRSRIAPEDRIKRVVYRLRGDGVGSPSGDRKRSGQIHVWDCDAEAEAGGGDEGSAPPVERFAHGIQISQARLGVAGFDGGLGQKEVGGKDSGHRWYRVCGAGENSDGATWKYEFHLEGVSIIRWECVSETARLSGRKVTRTVYIR
ncbi:hypothetical protein BO99DRAFT_402799 [Aspergillus violaceofuscus CBS 115571]|uniref:FAD/NAD(P)-binding domain-containing protein n=1 Tax=Aspergillus violaceofuscus (strain CBS 115571) TaxID=1450538 RepID=A0A2V5II60_ASPV1|nr:hypothetical protein BO99DRAFT_402799 [Aspergillus violaceofuscus CBS 115571]